MPQTMPQTVAFNLDKYLRDLKQEVEAALDASIAVTYPEKIYESPTNIFVARFLGSPAINFVEGIIRKKNGEVCLRRDKLTIPLS